MCSTPVCGILCGQRQSLAGAIPAGLCGILGSLLFHSVNNTKTAPEAAANQQSDELNWESASDNSWKEDEASGMSVYICQSCGGEIVADESTGASSCPFCGNPVVMSGKFSGTLRPDFIIPFKLDKKAAKAACGSGTPSVSPALLFLS